MQAGIATKGRRRRRRRRRRGGKNAKRTHISVKWPLFSHIIVPVHRIRVIMV
jgi:hypothetical protein